MFLHSRLALDICDTYLPHWETIRRMMGRFRGFLNISMRENLSVLNNRCFSLSLKDILRHVSLSPFTSQCSIQHGTYACMNVEGIG